MIHHPSFLYYNAGRLFIQRRDSSARNTTLHREVAGSRLLEAWGADRAIGLACILRAYMAALGAAYAILYRQGADRADIYFPFLCHNYSIPLFTADPGSGKRQHLL